MTRAARGFAVMDKARQRELAVMGGKAAHAQGTAHKWTRAEASAAGKKGSQIKAARRAVQRQQTTAA